MSVTGNQLHKIKIQSKHSHTAAVHVLYKFFFLDMRTRNTK